MSLPSPHHLHHFITTSPPPHHLTTFITLSPPHHHPTTSPPSSLYHHLFTFIITTFYTTGYFGVDVLMHLTCTNLR
jgi:hypothetical protein